jgi:hypothetical protein
VVVLVPPLVPWENLPVRHRLFLVLRSRRGGAGVSGTREERDGTRVIRV